LHADRCGLVARLCLRNGIWNFELLELDEMRRLTDDEAATAADDDAMSTTMVRR